MKQREIFIEAVQKEEGEERNAFLSEVCGGDEALRKAVEELLIEHQNEASFFLDVPPPGLAATAEMPKVTEKPGDCIGPYKLLQQIGEGGMGVVYMAEQTEPVERRVALKIIKPGMDTQQVIARFEAERQALAMMDHPHIAKVLDAGATDTGRPYFVMELVKGIPITSYCDQQHLSVRERLELFLPVCQAIQHAHQKGIIHRDAKPSNVLVARYDGKPVPKVIDFGVAKATSHRLTEKTMFTKFGQIVGTVEYMSPEQAEFNQLDIDTRSDIYSLGVLLYELLTGETPFDKQRLRSAAFDELLRILREEDPPRPSTKVSSSQSLAMIASNRKTDPGKLSVLVRNELDWIVMKAMEKERERRYETANAFAADVANYLNDEAVIACPPSAGYKFRKFARRNKTALTMTLLVLVFLITIGSGAGWVIRDRAARAEAAERERLALEEKARREMENRRDQLAARVEYVLEEVSKHKKSQDWIGVQEAIKRAKALLSGEDEFSDLTSQIQHHQRDYDFVQDLQNVRFNRAIPANGSHLRAIEKNANDQYETLFREFGIDLANLIEAEAAQKLRRHSDTIPVVSEALDDWAFLQPQKGAQAYKANRLREIAMAIDRDSWRNNLRDALIRDDREAIVKLANSGNVLEQSPATLWLLGKSLDKFGERKLAIGVLSKGTFRYPRDFWLNYLAGRLLGRTGKDYQDAVPYLAAAHAIRPSQYGAHHGFIDTLSQAGLHDQAIARYQYLIDNDRGGMWPHRGIASVYSRSGQHQQAIDHAEVVLNRNPSESWVPELQYLLASEYGKLGHREESLAWYEKCVRKELESGNDANLGQLNLSLRNFVQLHSTSGADRLEMLHELVTKYPESAACQFSLGFIHFSRGEWDEASKKYLNAVSLKPKAWVPHFELGITLGHLGRLDESINHFRKAIQLIPSIDVANRAQATCNIGVALEKKKDFAAAVNQYRKAIKIDPQIPGYHGRLGVALENLNQRREAIAAYRDAIRLYNQTLDKREEDGIESPRANEDVSGLVKYLTRLASLLAAAENAESRNPLEALTLARRASDLYSDELPDANWIAEKLAVTLSRLAWSLVTAKDAELRNVREAVTLARRAVEIAPKGGRDESWHWQTLGLALKESLHFEEAEHAYRTAIAKLDHRKRGEAAGCYVGLSDVLIQLRRTSEVAELVRAANQIPTEQKAAICNHVAWFLATAKDETLRDATEALTLARYALELDPDQPGYQNTLGAALYRDGQWKESIAALEKSTRQFDGGTAFDSFFLAMAHFRLEDQRTATKWYDKAVEWMEKHQPKHNELQRFRSEAERLLLEKKKTSGTKTK